MRSLEDLNNEVNHLNLEIRRLLLNKNHFNKGLVGKIAVVATISDYRERIVKLQREIRQRSDNGEY